MFFKVKGPLFLGSKVGNGYGDGDVFPVGCMTLPGPWGFS